MTLASSGVTTEGPLSGAAEAVVEVLGAEGLSGGGVHATVNAAIGTSTAKIRQRRRMLSLLFGFGRMPRLWVGAELRRLLDVIVGGGVGVDVLLGAEHEEEHHPADR